MLFYPPRAASFFTGAISLTRVLPLLIVALSAIAEYDAAAFPQYTAVDLGDLGGGKSYAYGVNDAGQVVGASTLASGATHAFLYENGVMHDLGTLGGSDSTATAINNAGTIAGFSNSTGDQAVDAFVYANSSMAALGVAVSRSGNGSATIGGINAQGQIVGYTETGGVKESFLYSDGKLTRLDQDHFLAADIDEKGRILGSIDGKARIYSAGKFSSPGALGNVKSMPAAINSRGEIAGRLADGHGFVYSSGKINLISKHDPGTTLDINDAGFAVGSYDFRGSTYAFDYYEGAMEAFVQFLRPAMTPAFENLNWLSISASKINNRGEVAGYGINGDGQVHAFLLEPVTPQVLIPGSGIFSVRTTHASQITLRGWTFGPVAQVGYFLGNGFFKPATGTARWNFTVRLKPGRNKIKISALAPPERADNIKVIVMRL